MEQGEEVDVSALLPLVYDKLRSMAEAQMLHERGGHTLQATALVHEAFIRLSGSRELTWKSKAHFFGAAAKSMRRILIDHARVRSAAKRGGGRAITAVSLAELVTDAPPEDLLAVDEAICQLVETDRRAGTVAQLRLYSGLSIAEIAAAMETPLRTVERDWAYARAWLHDRLR